MTWKDNLSEEQKQCMEELKRRTLKDLTPALLEDETLFYRFSKARDFMIDAAEAMLRKHIIWREQNKTDRLLTDYCPSEAILKYVPIHFLGYDKEGSPVLYVDLGNGDIKGVFNSIKSSDINTYIIYNLQSFTEKWKAQTEKLGKPVTMSFFIFNFENLTFANATNKKFIEMLVFFVRTYQDNYPERIQKIYFLNTPLFFTLVFNVVKHALSSVVRSKIQYYNPEDDWKRALLEKIGPEVLPAFLGGTRTDPDGNPRCITDIPSARKVPVSHYMANSVKMLSRAKDVRKVTVTRLSKETWSCDVTEPGSFLEWEFETKSKDIGFAVLYRPSRDCQDNELLPKQRIDTCCQPQKGFLRCDNPGTYICVFDNSYSWIYSKELYFKIHVTPPRELNGCN